MSKWGEFQGRIEDDRLITGRGRYVADFAVPRMAHGVVVRSQVAHATITRIDTAAAQASPGVLAVYTAADLAADGLPDFTCAVQLLRSNGEKAFPARRPILARDRIRAVGEPVAFIVAETVEAAEAAVELVDVVTEQLEAVTEFDAARSPARQACGVRCLTISHSFGKRALSGRL